MFNHEKIYFYKNHDDSLFNSYYSVDNMVIRLASLGFDMIAQELSIQVVVIGVAAILGYLLKSFFETKEEEKIKLEREKNQFLI